MKQIYLDYAAATPLDKRVWAAMQPYLIDKFYNPSALYHPARKVRQAIETARSQVAQALGAKAGEIVFMAGATESINLALRGFPVPRGEIIVSAIEHEAVMGAAYASGHKVVVCRVKSNGLLDLDHLEKLLNQRTRLVSIGYANSEIGTVQPMAELSKLIKAVNPEILIHSDASQAAGYLDLHVSRLGIDLLSLNGAKIYGPKQVGALYARSSLKLQPLIYGGGQEKGWRSGTENVAGIIGFARALEIVQGERSKESQRLTRFRDETISKIISRINNCHLNGHLKQRLPNNINLSIKGINGETLVHYLDHRGVLVATGAACSANKDTPSVTLMALGLSLAQVNSSLRITMGRQTTAQDMKILVKELGAAVSDLRTQTI